MTKTQWRRHQRKKNATMKAAGSSNNGKYITLMEDRMAKKPMREIFFPPFPIIVKPNGKDSLPDEDE